jgi:hypothetical protein
MVKWKFAVLVTALGSFAASAHAITTSTGQSWNFAPDAWVRGNTSETSYFGWDVIEAAGPPTGPFGSFKLDDATPDLGPPTTAAGTRIVQSNDSFAIYGHRSASGNYYSGFPANALADDLISAVAPTPAGQSGGFTTVVLQVIGQPTSSINDLTFTMDNVAAWTKQKGLYAVNSGGAGVHWQEWTAPGANLPFTIHMQSATSSRGIDAFQIDAHWSADGPLVNAITAIPEPASAGLAVIGLLSAAGTKRRLAAG